MEEPMPRVVASTHPLVQHKLTLLRSRTTEPKKFRELVRELTWLLAYEALDDLVLVDKPIETPMQPMIGKEMADRVGLVPILRAGLGMVDAMLEVLPMAEVWHIGLYRDHRTLAPVEYYNKLPVEPRVQVCLILDPMLATGGSATATVEILKRWGARRITFMGLIASPEGVRRMQTEHPDVDIHVAAIDDHLTDGSDGNPAGYIVPGLGDAGDRQFGTG
jgi:uracil phosphoribosyltransferase